MKLDVTGMDELMNHFEGMASNEISKYEANAVKAGAEIVKKNQEANWNRSAADGEHIEDNIIIGRAFDTEEGTGINVAPKMNLRWRAIFVEYGTSHQAPQAPVERSGQQSEAQATRAMMDELGKVVD